MAVTIPPLIVVISGRTEEAESILQEGIKCNAEPLQYLTSNIRRIQRSAKQGREHPPVAASTPASLQDNQHRDDDNTVTHVPCPKSASQGRVSRGRTTILDDSDSDDTDEVCLQDADRTGR